MLSSSSSSARIPHEGLVVIVMIVVVFVMAILCLAGVLNPKELLDGSLFRCCCYKENENDDNEYGRLVEHSYPTIDEYIFDSTSGEAGFVAMNDNDNDNDNDEEQQQPLTMNHVFPDLLAQPTQEEQEAAAAEEEE
eukprot:scaffold6219_cov146-Cylindrotheca_fusiformis.AAC.8